MVVTGAKNRPDQPRLKYWLLESHTAQYRFTLTLCGAASRRGMLMRSCRTAKCSFRLGPQEVTMNHNIVRQLEISDYKGQELLAT